MEAALSNKIFNPTNPPLLKRGEGRLFTKGARLASVGQGLGGITGLTLVEVMIALVIVPLVFLALMQTALVSIEANTVNLLREEAVSIAEMRMNQSRNLPFDSLVSDASSVPVTRNIRNITGGFTFNTLMAVTDLGGDNKQVNIAVTWQWKGNPYTHSITTIRRRT
jgi:Tfp pilus assembly protein PilV